MANNRFSFGHFGVSPFSEKKLGGKYRIFIGFDTSQSIAYHVLCDSIWRHIPPGLHDDVVIYPLILSDFQAMCGWERPHDPLQSTEFTYLRFTVPWHCDYDGVALFIDSDMLALGDVTKLFRGHGENMGDYALKVVQHDHRPTNQRKMGDKVQTAYPRKNWSSVMLMDCSKLTLWSLEAAERWSGKQLHRFEGIADAQIGSLPGYWNDLDRYDTDTMLLHYTDGGPWLPGYENHAFGDVWFEAKQELLGDKKGANPDLQ